MPTVARTNPRTAEFARLFELFDRIATRRARGSTELPISMDDIAAVPAEFAPILKNLSTILSIRALRDEDRLRKPTGRPRRNTVAIAPAPHNITEDVGSPTFPLEEPHPFTFKLMLHKLYDVDEWAEKVKSAVEASKDQFKPLAERMQEIVREATGKERVARRNVGRARSQSVLNPRSKGKVLAREQISPSTPPADDRRVVKKRCVGRRKSISGPSAGGVWVYDAAISAVELNGPHPSVKITLSESKDTLNNGSVRSRHQSLAGLGCLEARDSARRKVRIAIPLMRDDVQSNPVPHEQTAQASARHGIVARDSSQRATSARGLSIITEPRAPRQQMKRPLISY
ncbi:hypothetical protein M405DRAFT_288533 [Rhizopogon salebrosus TDB-379]|nr:hypothetical protein M405DRAFT_288533 [Rhizopogon salebrosus TDB-379]